MMMISRLTKCQLVSLTFLGLLFFSCSSNNESTIALKLNDSSYFEARGLNVMVFSNKYNGLFSDSKMSGVEIIHHGVRTATNGDVRLNPTPEQWDAIPQYIKRNVDRTNQSIQAQLKYPDYDFNYVINTEARDGGILLTVNLDKPLPKELEGRAGFNLEFLPSAYFEKTYLMDSASGVFPLYPSSAMISKNGVVDPLPIATGRTLVLAPEDPSRRVTIKATDTELALYDGRDKAQNGWYVVRSVIPPGKSGRVIEWFITANVIRGWTRPAVIAHSQIGYHPDQKKVAVIELDKNDRPSSTAKLLKVNRDGKASVIYKSGTKSWGTYLRYNYESFDFSSVKENGVYVIEYGDVRTKPFRIATDVYQNAWQPTLDVYFPVQMDHMFVNEAYRVWHGASHLDDALQAPVNHEHFDLYAQGASTDSPYKPGEHIPLNVGGWYDAGDFDIRTQTQYSVVLNLVLAYEAFGITRDETTINQDKRYVDIHVPDGKPDILQQIEHGTLQLLAQHKMVGHAINGIVEAHLSQYTHLGDAVTKTDNLVYDSRMTGSQSDKNTSGVFDDRWAFTSKSSSLNYGSIAALAAASRALKGYNDKLAEECLAMAKKVWAEEHSHAPDLFHHGNTTGGKLEDEELKAAVELLICTKDTQYVKRITELWPAVEKEFARNGDQAARVLSFLSADYTKKLESLVKSHKTTIDQFQTLNPFGVFISTQGWAGGGQVIEQAMTNYFLHKAFPEIMETEDVFKGLNYIYGCHPGSDISFVSGVGTQSKMVAYGNNRADFSFIAGGIVPGVLILPPDFPENKEDWPFLWGENEYVINLGASYIFLVNAANELSNKNTRTSTSYNLSL